jgi:lipopolysaccharide export system ATP-binding protein
MTPPNTTPVQAVVDRYAGGDRGASLALLALLGTADDDGSVSFHDLAVRLRSDYIASVRAEGRDADAEAGRIGIDDARTYLLTVIVPRLVAAGAIEPLVATSDPTQSRVRASRELWATARDQGSQLTTALRQTGEFAGTPRLSGAPRVEGSSILKAEGLVKTYRGRNVVNNVALELHQGEIVGLLGPNGAGKTTTFYMIVGLIPPASGRILFDGEDITAMPMYKRARRGIGYLSQEPSIFRKLTVEENILAILETLDIPRAEREQRLEGLLRELKIEHLRRSKAFALSGGERRRLEITRALVTQPKFMMLDEPFAGVDPIAVHDIQQIVSSLKHRGIGVLISDHNVEQTLDIVDRAYIMFDGQVKAGGTVRELVFDDTVAEIYLGPTLTARLRSRFLTERGDELPAVATAATVAAVETDAPVETVVDETPPESSA